MLLLFFFMLPFFPIYALMHKIQIALPEIATPPVFFNEIYFWEEKHFHPLTSEKNLLSVYLWSIIV